MQKKVFRRVPVWLIIAIIVTSSTVVASGVLSNKLTSTVTVGQPPVKLTGAFVTSTGAGIPKWQTLNYETFTTGSAGRIWFTFTGTALTSKNDISINLESFQVINANFRKATIDYQDFVNGELIIVIANTDSNDMSTNFNFGTAGNTGQINFDLTFAKTGTYTCNALVFGSG
jgi:hypothetical protein